MNLSLIEAFEEAKNRIDDGVSAPKFPGAYLEAFFSSIKSLEEDLGIKWNGDGWYELPVGADVSHFVYIAADSEANDLRVVRYAKDPREALIAVACAPQREVTGNVRRILELRAEIRERQAEIARLGGGA